jgi:putative tryptophan/tyrosine transport system substrate-binding protein
MRFGHSLMDRRQFLAGLSAVLLSAADVGEAQSGRTFRVGWLAIVQVPPDVDSFQHGMRDLGYVEGVNLMIDQRYPGAGRAERFVGLASDLARLKVDVIVTTGAIATKAAQNTTSRIPIVFVTGDPVRQGFVQSLSRPGGMLTGVTTFDDPGLNGKRIQILKEAVPAMTRLGVLKDESGSSLQTGIVEAIDRVCQQLGIKPPLTLRVTKADDLDSVFATGVKQRIGGLLVLSSPFLHSLRMQITNLAARHRLPAVYEHRNFVDVGGLMSYGFDIGDVFRRVAIYVDRVLKGARPADLPVEQLNTIELALNIKTAKSLGLVIPQTLLQRADQVIQ